MALLPQHGRHLTLALALATGLDATDALAGPAFAKRLEVQGFAFDITATNEESSNTFLIFPTGLSQQAAPITFEIEGIG
jgi:hypothetical protein